MLLWQPLFGFRWAITSVVLIASHTIFDSTGGFLLCGVKLSDEYIADFKVLRDVAMATNFGTKIALTGFV